MLLATGTSVQEEKAEPNRFAQYIHPIIYTQVQENKVILIVFKRHKRPEN